MDLGLRDKTVLIVGASKGIGKGIALGFAKENCNIVAIARSEELLKELEVEAMETGAASFKYIVHDIMQGSANEFAKQILESAAKLFSDRKEN